VPRKELNSLQQRIKLGIKIHQQKPSIGASADQWSFKTIFVVVSQ
jgi:hypothetical protein